MKTEIFYFTERFFTKKRAKIAQNMGKVVNLGHFLDHKIITFSNYSHVSTI
jgi:hypothetical protein